MKIAAAIIAGGRSARMGTNKSLLRVGQATILQRIVACLRHQSDHVMLNSNISTPEGEMTGLPVVPDRVQNVQTPLAGLHAALVWSAGQGCEWVLTVPGDTPFLPADLTSRLLAAAGESKAAIAASGGQSHYVIGLWPTSLAAELETAMMRDGMFRVRDWASHVKAITVEWPVDRYDPFFNVNTPEELARARLLAEELGL